MAHIDNWARVDVSTLESQFLNVVRPGLRKHALLALLMANKRIKYKMGGKTSCDWRMRYRRNTPDTHGDMEAVNTPRVNRHKEATLPWRAYIMGESISKYEMLVQQDKKSRLFDLVEEVTKGMGDDFNEDFQVKCFGDGGTAGSKQIHGLESMFSTSGTFTDARLLKSNETYAGINCTPANYGGAWTGTYPDGTGDLRYHFATPCVVNYAAGSSVWDASEASWAYTWRLAMGLANTVQDTLHGTPADVWITTATMLRLAKDSLIDKERIAVDKNGPLTKLGFKVIEYEGSEIASAYGCTADSCYGLPIDKIELRCMQDKLFKSDKQEDITEQTRELVMDFWGNFMFQSPAFFSKLINA